ncbi:uncharacterized protein LOC8056164 [Sorghum bicolor]|uniref:F-box protein n=1 Tax=Sorghum bicolor TaxID=4558 RepID=C5XG60_SORBI|nr:uncharacterized protein LOC8056164 [Sorghum bicolor]EES04094.1 hypothetical protein SORBI_3003G399500 [Sorghum bicolor]|eukprot:XP_002458974.1 uncharacterized protein LOC8056164 [Sorghum bicolor]
MDGLPRELCINIFHLLDHQSLASAPQVCRKWRALTSDDELWRKLFNDRWGADAAAFYAPEGSSKSWKDVFVLQDRSHRSVPKFRCCQLAIASCYYCCRATVEPLKHRQVLHLLSQGYQADHQGREGLLLPDIPWRDPEVLGLLPGHGHGWRLRQERAAAGRRLPRTSIGRYHRTPNVSRRPEHVLPLCP